MTEILVHWPAGRDRGPRLGRFKGAYDALEANDLGPVDIDDLRDLGDD